MRVITIKCEAPGIPDQESATELAEYITDAIQSWGGQRHPDDWLFRGLKVRTITIGNFKFSGDVKW